MTRTLQSTPFQNPGGYRERDTKGGAAVGEHFSSLASEVKETPKDKQTSPKARLNQVVALPEVAGIVLSGPHRGEIGYAYGCYGDSDSDGDSGGDSDGDGDKGLLPKGGKKA